MDLSPNDFSRPKALEDALNLYLANWERQYGTDKAERSYEQRFGGVIQRAHKATGKKAVVLIDEYDSPLIANLHRRELFDQMRDMLKAFYTNIKSNDAHIQFAFITGVSRFSKMTIFSGLNNLKDISLDDRYAGICGFTDEEISRYLDEGISQLAEKHNIDKSEARLRLKAEYDGYRFSRKKEDIYNPFSLIWALDEGELGNYWFASGTPSFLINLLERNDWDLTSLGEAESEADRLSDVEIFRDDPIPLLFQAGYLTITDYDPETKIFTLGFPNREVKNGFLRLLIPSYSHQAGLNTASLVNHMLRELRKGDLDECMAYLDSVFSAIPYEDAITEEKHFRSLIFAILHLLGTYIHCELHTFRGRLDAAIFTPKFIYILEMKYAKTPNDALRQIEEKEYAAPYQKDGRVIITAGINFNPSTRHLEWAVGQ